MDAQQGLKNYETTITSKKGTKPIQICWQKLDSKSKKVNFLINQSMSALDDKAGVDTVENLQEQIESL